MSKASNALAVRSVKQEVVSQQLVEKARSFAVAAKSERTRVEYARDWATFTTWCKANRLVALPAEPETIALFLTARASEGRKVSTITRALAAISGAHKAAGLPSPRGKVAVQEVLKGIRRSLGVAQTQKAPLLPGQLREIVAALSGNGLIGLRDRALLLLGFAGAFRRSELVGLDLADFLFDEEGLTVTLRRSKTDQEGAGRKIGIPTGRRDTCPVAAVKAWIEAAKIESGPIFREVTRHGKVSAARLSGRSVARIVKRSVESVGIDPGQFAGHSLRAGLVTAAAKAHKSIAAIQKQTGHRSVAMVSRYIRDADLFDDNAADDLL